jgi:hypothetical protein
MFCVFLVDRRAPSGADIVAERMGLSVEEMVRPDAVLMEAHLEGNNAEQQALLRPHVGQLMCELTQATGLSALGADEFMPSVPFVSLQAAC